MNDPNLARFRDFLIVEFSEEQLAELCQDVGLNYADLPGTGAYGKTRELIEIARSRRLLSALMDRAKELRPDAYRNASIKDVEQDGAATAEAIPLVEPNLEAPHTSTSDSDGGLQMLQRPAPQEERAALLATLTPRARLLAILVAVLLLVVAALTIILPKQGGNANIPTPDATTLAISSTQMTAEAAALAQPTIAPAVVDTTTQSVDTTAAMTDTMTNTQTTTEQPAGDAAAAVKSINDQLIQFYTGKVEADAVKPHFAAGPYKAVTTFAYTTLKRSLGIDITKGDLIDVELRYVKEPQQTANNGDTYTVSSTEYWGYTNPGTNRSLCDTRNYVYTLTKDGENYQVTGLKSTLVSKTCEQ
jgi:hypothetical protein